MLFAVRNNIDSEVILWHVDQMDVEKQERTLALEQTMDPEEHPADENEKINKFFLFYTLFYTTHGFLIRTTVACVWHRV